MIRDIDAVAFDIDGTLYPNLALYLRLIPFFVHNRRLMSEFGQVRREIRRWQHEHPQEVHQDFMLWQAQLLSRRLGCTAEEAGALLDERIYKGWIPVFESISLYPGVRETFAAFRAASLKIGILSDFLPSQKGELWGLPFFCDVVLGSEETGAVKPSIIPFRVLAERLGCEASRILYVGNSPRSDIDGARKAGMKSALITGPFGTFFLPKDLRADISFRSYRQLTANVLK